METTTNPAAETAAETTTETTTSPAAPVTSARDPMRPLAHYKPVGGWVGDVHPTFWNGRWCLPYLEVPASPLRHVLNRLQSVMAVSDDLLHWEPQPVANAQDKAWWLIANLLHAGRYYSFYNGQRGINLTVSEDGRTWSLHPTSPVLPASSPLFAELRDPCIFREEASQEFVLVCAVRKARDLPHEYSGAFVWSRSEDLIRWSPWTVLHDPGNISIPECPDLFRMEGRYYLMGNWAPDRVGSARYYVADRLQGPWRQPAIPAIDSSEISAPVTTSDGKRRLLFGWIPTYGNNADHTWAEWGGHLAFPRELYVGPDGELLSRPPAELLRLRHTLLYPSDSGRPEASIGAWELADGEMRLPSGSDYGEALLPGGYDRFEMGATITLVQGCRNAGFLFRAGDTKFPGYELAIDLEHQRMILRSHLDRRRVLSSQPIRIRAGVPMSLRVFVDGNIVEAFLDDRFSLAGRAHAGAAARRIGFYGEGGGFAAGDIRVHALKAIYTQPEPPPVELRPQPDPRRPGSSLLLAENRSHVYSPFDPALNPPGSFTLECWIKPTKGTGQATRNLIVKGDIGYHYGLNIRRDGALEFYFRGSQDFYRLASPAGVMEREGEWVHVAGAFDAERGEMRLYRNGEALATRAGVTDVPDPSHTGGVRLGYAAGLWGSQHFYGLMDEVRLWNRARTGQQIHAASRVPLAASQDGLVLYWKFDTTAEDLQHGGRPAVPNYVNRHPSLRGTFFDGAALFPEDGHGL